MKMVLTLACGAAMICNFAQAQDTTLAKIDKTETTITKKEEMTTPVLIIEDVSAEKRSESKFNLPDYSKKNSILNNKVGPNGEDLFMKKNKYYYIDGAGKKVKARRTNLTDKPKSS